MSAAPAAASLRLNSGQVHLWQLYPENIAPAAAARAYADLLSDAERDRHEALLLPQARQEFLLSRLLLRQVLSFYEPVSATAWRFSRDAHGKPQVTEPPTHGQIHFNLSHTAGLIAAIFSRDAAVGIDVEDTARASQTAALAARYFAPAEVAALQALPPEVQRQRFFAYWTLKEAYVKARGVGLRVPLNQFAFRWDSAAVDQAPNVQFTLAPACDDDAQQWQFGLWQPDARHQGAWAIRLPPQRRLKVRLFSFPP